MVSGFFILVSFTCSEQSNDRGGEGIGEKYPLLHGECDQKGPSRVWDRIFR